MTIRTAPICAGRRSRPRRPFRDRAAKRVTSCRQEEAWLSALRRPNEELIRAVKMSADALDYLIAEASLRDGRRGEDMQARLHERREEARNGIDAGFALELAGRLGEDALPRSNRGVLPTERADIPRHVGGGLGWDAFPRSRSDRPAQRRA